MLTKIRMRIIMLTKIRMHYKLAITTTIMSSIVHHKRHTVSYFRPFETTFRVLIIKTGRIYNSVTQQSETLKKFTLKFLALCL